MHYFRIKPDSAYSQDLNQARLDEKRLSNLSAQLRIEINLPPSDYFSTDPKLFYHPPESISPELKTYFKKDGIAKKNAFVHKRYLELVTQEGLTNFKDMRLIHFTYGVMKTSMRQSLKRFIADDVHYIETDAEFSERELAHLEEISEVEFRQIHLDALKKAEEA